MNIKENKMKKTTVFLSMIVAIFVLATSGIAQEKKEVKKKKKIETVTCWASIDCEACKAKVEKNIAYEKGVKDLKVDLENKLITVSYRSDKTSAAKIEKAIKKLGYKTEIIPPAEKKDTKTTKK